MWSQCCTTFFYYFVFFPALDVLRCTSRWRLRSTHLWGPKIISKIHLTEMSWPNFEETIIHWYEACCNKIRLYRSHLISLSSVGKEIFTISTNTHTHTHSIALRFAEFGFCVYIYNQTNMVSNHHQSSIIRIFIFDFVCLLCDCVFDSVEYYSLSPCLSISASHCTLVLLASRFSVRNRFIYAYRAHTRFSFGLESNLRFQIDINQQWDPSFNDFNRRHY